LHREILSVRGIDDRLPILVPLGPFASKALGLRGNITEIVGKVLTARVGTNTYKTVPLLSMTHLQAEPGLTAVVVTALLKAAKLAYGETEKAGLSFDEITKDYVFPRTIEEVEKLVDESISYTEDVVETAVKRQEMLDDIREETAIKRGDFESEKTE